jgi:hypothetical protein
VLGERLRQAVMFRHLSGVTLPAKPVC